MKKKQKTLKDYSEISFLSERKNDLNEISNEEIIYEESQTGPQEEPTLKEMAQLLEKSDLVYKNTLFLLECSKRLDF